MRLFIGISLPDEFKNAIDRLLTPLHFLEKGWEYAHDYHLTLLFIGNYEEEKLPLLKKRLDQITFKSFKIRIKGISFFNKRIMYLEIYPSLELIKLKASIDLMFPEYLRPDEKEFIPHITIKRWQRYEMKRLKEGVNKIAIPNLQFDIEFLSLFESKRDEQNFKYHVIYNGVKGSNNIKY